MVKRSYLAVALIATLVLTSASPAFAQSPTNGDGGQSLGSNNACTTLGVAGLGAAAIQVGGTFVGTVTWTVSVNGTSFAAVDAFPPDTTTAANTATAAGQWGVSVAGYRFLRACMSPYTSGAALVMLSASPSGGGSSSGGGGGGGGTTQDTDDGSIATGQSADLGESLQMVYDGTVWRRASSGAAAIDTGTQRVTIGSDDLVPVTLASLLAAFPNEDAVAQTGDRGAANLCVRENTAPTASGANLDYIWAKCDANGRLFVNATFYNEAGTALSIASDTTLDSAVTTTGPLLVARGSTATPGAMSTDNDGTALWTDLIGRLHLYAESNEDTASANLDGGMRVFAIRDDTLDARSGTEGDFEWFHTTATGGLWVTLATAAGAAITTGTDYVQDVALTVSTTAGPMTTGRASTTPPTAVSTADDAVIGWFGLKGAQATFSYGIDPCASNGIAHSSIEVSSNADEISIPLTASQTIYVCGFAVTSSGTTPTFRWVTGTGSACATSQTVLTGLFAVSSTLAPIVFGNGAGTILTGDIGEDVCLDVGATTDVQGVITYVKMVPPTL